MHAHVQVGVIRADGHVVADEVRCVGAEGGARVDRGGEQKFVIRIGEELVMTLILSQKVSLRGACGPLHAFNHMCGMYVNKACHRMNVDAMVGSQSAQWAHRQVSVY